MSDSKRFPQHRADHWHAAVVEFSEIRNLAVGGDWYETELDEDRRALVLGVCVGHTMVLPGDARDDAVVMVVERLASATEAAHSDDAPAGVSNGR